MPVNLANTRMHWRTKFARHQAWKLRAIVEEKQLRGQHQPMERVRVTALFTVGRVLMDEDNCVARLKWPLDLLKERGLIVDDALPHLTLAGIPEQRRGTPRQVVLTLEEVA